MPIIDTNLAKVNCGRGHGDMDCIERTFLDNGFTFVFKCPYCITKATVTLLGDKQGYW